MWKTIGIRAGLSVKSTVKKSVNNNKDKFFYLDRIPQLHLKIKYRTNYIENGCKSSLKFKQWGRSCGGLLYYSLMITNYEWINQLWIFFSDSVPAPPGGSLIGAPYTPNLFRCFCFQLKSSLLQTDLDICMTISWFLFYCRSFNRPQRFEGGPQIDTWTNETAENAEKENFSMYMYTVNNRSSWYDEMSILNNSLVTCPSPINLTSWYDEMSIPDKSRLVVWWNVYSR